jgi:threonine/homoserine/homoserine lactone efflux protein
MKASDWVVRTLVALTFVALLIAPDTYGGAMGFISLLVVGVWSILYPQGVMGWAKTAHPSLNVDDSSLWWVPRLIGCFFLMFAVIIAVARWR